MKTTIILVLATVLSFNALWAQQTLNQTLLHDEIEREYILYVPASYDPDTPVPLVLCFHGYTSSAATNFDYTNFRAIADTAGFILIHPQGTLFQGNTHWNVGGWTIGSTTDDVGFTAALLDSITTAYNIDEERVYSTGMSNGGYMSFLLACQLSDRIAAIASVTGSMTIQTYNDCDPQHPTPVLQIHGTADGVVPYNGNPAWTKSIDDVIDYWVAYNECEATPSVADIPNTNTSDGSTVDHIIYSEGNNEVNTEHFKVFGGDHDWPGSWGNMDIDASIEVWKFFSRYDINGRIGSTTTGLNENDVTEDAIRFSPNPVASTISLAAEELVGMNYHIYSAFGQLVLQGRIGSTSEEIDLSGLKPNVYFLNVGTQVMKLVKVE